MPLGIKKIALKRTKPPKINEPDSAPKTSSSSPSAHVVVKQEVPFLVIISWLYSFLEEIMDMDCFLV